MFKDKGGKTVKNKLIAEVKVVNASINMVDVHVTTQNMAIEEQNYNELGIRGYKFKSSWWKPYNRCR
jgi:hypothetical protein